MEETTNEIINWMLENCRQIPVGSAVSSDSPLLDEGWLDSLQTMHLITHLENLHHVVFPIEEMVPENFETPSLISQLIHRLPKKP